MDLGPQYLGTSLILGSPPPHRGDEETPYPTRHTQPYSLSKAQAERLVLDANGVTVCGVGGGYGVGRPMG